MPTCPLPKVEVPSPTPPPPPTLRPPANLDLDPIVDEDMSDDVFDDFEKEVRVTTFKQEEVDEAMEEENKEEEEKRRQTFGQMTAAGSPGCASSASASNSASDLGLEDDFLQINRELKMELESFNTSLDKWTKSGSCASPGSSHFEFTCTDILSGSSLGAADCKMSW